MIGVLYLLIVGWIYGTFTTLPYLLTEDSFPTGRPRAGSKWWFIAAGALLVQFAIYANFAHVWLKALFGVS